MTNTDDHFDVCVVGGGPAGMVLGLLLAKMNIKVLVLERHKNFEREYRGEVLMPRFTQMFKQINLFDLVEKSTHLKLKHLEGVFRDKVITRIEFADVSPEVPFAIWMSQLTLLNALYERAKTFPHFHIWFGASVQDLIKENGKVVGVKVDREGQPVTVRANLTVGADGRTSAVRKHGDFEIEDEAYNLDIIWFTIPKPPEYDNTVRFFINFKRNFLILPKLPDSIQIGMVAEPGEFVRFREQGIDSLRRELLSSHPVMHDFAKSLKDFSPFNVLQARIQLVKEWAKDGCLLIGDAAHTCSPAGAIGVSVAVATAIVAADVIKDAVAQKDFSAECLSRVQKLREAEVREIQATQKRLTSTIFSDSFLGRSLLPVIIWVTTRTGIFQRIQRRILVMKEPLPIGKEIPFK